MSASDVIKRLRLAKSVLQAKWYVIKSGVTYREDKKYFFFLSTGHVGTRFFSHALNTATNATVLHQPSPQLWEEGRALVRLYVRKKEQFLSRTVAQMPRLHAKLAGQLYRPEKVYGDTLNHMFPFGYALYKHLGPARLRLVHLIRDPVACGKSILKAERDDTGHGRFDLLRPKEFLHGTTPAEKAASVWLGTNEMIRYQFSQINDENVCKVIRLEDMSVDSIRELFSFLGLEGFDADRISSLMHDRTTSVRHSHLDKSPERPPATEVELRVIAERCRSLAHAYGYHV